MFARKTEEDIRYGTSTIKRASRWLLILSLALSIGSLVLARHSLSSEAKENTGATKVGPVFDTKAERHVNGASDPDGNSSEPFLQANSTQVVINFDDVPPFTDISTRYPHVAFSSPGLSVYSWPAPYPRTAPNAITRGTIQGWNIYNNHYADLIADFAQPVNDLRFYITGGDSFGTVALMDYYQNGNLTQSNIPIGGPGPSHQPIPIDFQTPGIGNITRIRIHNITDYLGVSFDDFSFTVPTATPTPTPAPSPTPPLPPTNLRAVPDEESATLFWAPSTGATRYIVKRTGDCTTDDSTITTKEAAVAVESPLTPMAVIPVDSTTFTDSKLCGDVDYIYVVSAVGPGGESLNSAAVSVTPLPKPGCGTATNHKPQINVYNFASQHGWSMYYAVTENEGLVLRNISLNGRLMAERISTPYYWLDTQTAGQSGIKVHGELRPADGMNISPRSRLVGYNVNVSDPNKLVLEAKYEVDRIPGTPQACLNVSQKYQFYKEGFGGRCEPSGEISSCARFRPMTSYSFHGGQGEHLNSINLPQRHHYKIYDLNEQTAGFFRDADFPGEPLLGTPPTLGIGFMKKDNPLTSETFFRVIKPYGEDAKVRDNFHQANGSQRISEPGDLTSSPNWRVRLAGCPECFHFHWRWGKWLKFNGRGFPNIPQGSTQSLDLAVVRYRPQEEKPWDYGTLLVPNESLRDTIMRPNPNPLFPPILVGGGGTDLVFWYSPHGFSSSDTFFFESPNPSEGQYAWFNARDPQIPATTSLTWGNASAPENNVPQDGPISVIFGNVYEAGATTVDLFDLSSLPPLPSGYAPLNNIGYKIDTTGIVSGPDVITLSASSVSDQDAFSKLRVFHAEPDSFDPEKPIWLDRTILTPDTPAPDFSAKTLSARADELGVFVVGKQIQAPQPETDVANLSVNCVDSSDPSTAGNNLTYTIRVTNNGPQTANEVALVNGLSSEVDFVSAVADPGTCKKIDGTVYCRLNSLPSGATTTISIIVKPTEGVDSFPAEGKSIATNVMVRAKEPDSDASDNSVTETTIVLPNPNKAPSVSITSPTTGALLVGPTNITINATATDSDGTISKVEFFDNGELIGVGTPSGNNQYVITRQNASFGEHSLITVATDNGGRQNISNAANVIVNGAANVTITSPSSGALFAPASNVTITANAIHPFGIINKVEFFASGGSIGEGVLTGGNQYGLSWNNVNAGVYSIVAVATDGSAITTTSAPVNVTVDTPPTVTMSTPADGAVFPSATNISVSATAQDVDGSIARVDFYANGVLVGSATDIATTTFIATWRQVPDGVYSLTAIATDNLGVSSTSAAITIGVNTPSPRAGEFIWFDDDVPPGATPHGDGESWYWVDANPGAFSGTKAHQSRNFAQLDAPNTSFHQHYFDGATMTLPVNAGDKLFTYVFLDINNMPREIMLQWNDGNGWEHRAYWGQNTINLGADGTSSRRYMGPLPKAGQWVRLEAPASAVGLEGATLSGMAFSLDAGRATFDLAGKTTANATPPPTSPDEFVWFEDAVPAGSILETIADQWKWEPPGYFSQYSHRSYFTVNGGQGQFRSHSFRAAQTPMTVEPGAVLFTYVFVDPNNKPDELVLQWHDGSSWEHRAYWGQNFFNIGITGTESRRFMGGLPTAGQWVRLEVPASYVGLEGKTVSGMAFGFYSARDHAGINWDRSGKSAQVKATPLPLTAITPVWQFFNSNYGWSYSTNDIGRGDQIPQGLKFYVHPNQAAATVPFYRFRNSNNGYFYSTCKDCFSPSVWVYDGIAFYVYPDSTTPGTVPLYLFHDTHFRYFFTTDQNEGISKGLVQDNFIPAYVNATNPLVPAAPSDLYWDGRFLRWKDNSANEAGFKIERVDWNGSEYVWNLIATVPANTPFFKLGSLWSSFSHFRIRATNSFGDSDYSNSVCGCFEVWATSPNTPPEIYITNPTSGDVVGTDFSVSANVFDNEGAGTIAKVEFYADGNKLGESSEAPYFFVWNNVLPGTYVLTATATDTAGATTTSNGVTVTVAAPTPTPTPTPSPSASPTPTPVPLRANVALASNGGVATASSTYSPSQGQGYSAVPTEAINGDRTGKVGSSTAWWNDGTLSVGPDWLQVDFNGSKTIDEIDLFTTQDNYTNPSEPTETMTFTLYGLTGYEVQYWDGANWTDVTGGNFSGNNKVWRKITFSPITTTKIRVLANASPDGWSRVTEVEAWGNVAPPPRTNVALSSNGATASASSTYSPSQGQGYSAVPAEAINGDRTGKVGSSTAWWNDGTQNSGPDWLQVDFNGSKTIDEIDLFTTQDNFTNPSEPTETMTFTLYGLTGYEVQYWDGASWVAVPNGSISGNNKVWRKIPFSAITTTRIRVLANTAPDGWSRVTELEAWGNVAPPPRMNVALSSNGATASASSTYSPSQGQGYSAVPAEAINGDRTGKVGGSTAWWNDGTPSVGPDWLQVDFNGSKTIDEIDLFTTQDNYNSPVEPSDAMTFSLYGLTGYDVQYWNGASWTDVTGGNVSGNNNVWRKFTFSPITTTKIRVLTNASPDGWSRLTEVEAWGTAT